MAYQIINTYKIYEYEQQEMVSVQEVAGEDGVVSQVETLIQPYIHIWADLTVKQELLAAENKSNFEAELILHATTGEKGEDELLITPSIYRTSDSFLRLAGVCYAAGDLPSANKVSVAPGETKTILLSRINAVGSNTGRKHDSYWYHDLDGTFSYFTCPTLKPGQKLFLTYDGGVDFTFKGNIGGEIQTISVSQTFSDKKPTPLANNRSIVPILAQTFSDIGNGYVIYSTNTGTSRFSPVSPGYAADSIESLQMAFSFNGEMADIAYRDIPIQSTVQYTFEFTEAEREILRQKAQGSNVVPIYYLIKVVRKLNTETKELISATQRTITIIDCDPQLNPTVKDVNAKTLELTGDENKFIKYCSTAQFSIGATARKYATIISQQIINGTHTVSNLSSGTIEEVDSDTFYFSATDSRNLTVQQAVVKDLVPYVKLTNRISEAKLNTDGVLSFVVSGNYYNGSFGAQNNSLEFQYGLKEEDGETVWHNVEITPSFSGNTYTINYSIPNLQYTKKYTLITNITDKIKSVQSEPKVIASIPVFDWSKTDFRHRTDVYLDKGKKLMTNGNLDIIAVNDTFTVGNSSTDIAVLGKTIKLNGMNYGTNTVLWNGIAQMGANQTVEFTKSISEMPNGIVLVFSLFRNNSAEDISINSFFVSKKEIELLSGAPHSFFMLVDAGFSTIGAKYLYINDSSISGHEGNISSGTNSGITFNNSNYVLRYVIGC